MNYNYGKLLSLVSDFGWNAFFAGTQLNKEHFFDIAINYGEFTALEIKRMCEVLNIISPLEVKELFFTQRVEKKQL